MKATLTAILTAALLTGTTVSAQTVRSQPDWLVDPSPFKAHVTKDKAAGELVLDNGLLRRVIRLTPNAATVDYRNLSTGAQLLRSIRPEATVTLDGTVYPVGGLVGQPVHNYLNPDWLKTMTSPPGAYVFDRVEIGATHARFPWKKRLEWMPRDMPWPPPGKSATLFFRPPAAPPVRTGLPEVAIHYEIYDGIPLLCKWVTLVHRGEKAIRLNTLTTEILAAVEPESYVGRPIAWMTPRPDIYVESDYAMAGDGNSHVANRVVRWGSDPLYGTQVHYDRQTPCLLECRLERGPDQEIAPGGTFESFRIFELLQDGGDRERTSLAQRRMYRTVAPYVTQNPILMHVRGADAASVRTAIDQCAEVGFQMVIMTFLSGFNFESRDKVYQAQYKELADYAHSKGIALGGYSLLASHGAGNGADNTQGAPTSFGVMPCLGATWGIEYLAQLKDFIATAGLDVLEHDGSYPGDECAATTHPGHRGLNDSQWVMWKAITGLYRWCLSEGVYMNVPDWYILGGATKTYMGYRETNWSLPREYQEIIERQNCFDGTWEKTPSMGWMFVPLTEYQGGGAAATIEPLKDHLPHYEARFADLFGYGVQACYRGPRLYDTEITKSAVMHWTSFYRAHRTVLNGDIIHLRRADGRDWDGILHVDPQGTEKALAMFYNPLTEDITRTIRVPLHYAGLTGKVWAATEDGKHQRVTLDSNEEITLKVKILAGKRTWVVFTSKP